MLSICILDSKLLVIRFALWLKAKAFYSHQLSWWINNTKAYMKNAPTPYGGGRFFQDVLSRGRAPVQPLFSQNFRAMRTSPMPAR